ncbi:hypothetical protein [Parasitella parasitica]|uniref:Uncharacterized protein n=1 Tax=Parasitella parasitica TaxID=35722 RepID=A0A0B7NEG0_9FUNG|nr:hypothetical protein [Parasitella parasitica]
MKVEFLYVLLVGLIGIVFAQDSTGEATQAVTTEGAQTIDATVDATVTATAIAATDAVETTTADVDTTTAVDPTTAAATSNVAATTSSSSASATSTTDTSSCLDADSFSTHDYFPSKLDFSKLDSTAQFNVTYSNTYKLVHNIALDEYYVLYCTKAAPSLGSTFQSKTYIQIPVSSFAAVDTRVLGFLDLLGQSNNVAFVGNTSNVTTPCITNKPAYFNVSDPNLDRTKYGLAFYPTSPSNDPNGVGLGIGYANTPLGNAQWVKYIALFTNQETLADTIYDDISTDYNTYRNSLVNHISYKRNITFMDYDTSSTKFNIMQDQYFQNLTSDAGATLIVPTVLQPADPSVMKGQLQNTSLVIDLTSASAFNSTYGGWQNWLGFSDDKISSTTATQAEAFKQTRKYVNSVDAPPFARNKQAWRLDLVSDDGSLDWWTRGMARPDLLLQDLIQAQFPDYFKTRNRVFLRAFANDESSRTASQDSYQCNLNNWEKAASVSYSNTASDTPTLEALSNKLSLGAIVGISIGGGLVALTCLATVIAMFIRKFKDGGGKRFTRLHDETMSEFGALDRDPMIIEEITAPPGGRLGGSGRGH